MGDVCNMNDCERFLRSDTGKAYLDEITAMLKGKTIVDVSYSNEVQCIATTLHLDDGTTFDLWQPSFDVDALREQFAEVLEEEYFKDYPARRPAENNVAGRASDGCSACAGRGWLLMFNETASALELQRCDSCSRFRSDGEAQRFVAEDHSVCFAALMEFCRALVAEVNRRTKEVPNQEELKTFLQTVSNSLRNAVRLQPDGPIHPSAPDGEGARGDAS
ncbi:MAG: hypothetical protein KJ060_19325 [Candidatus Hydrogenedentes bacterium]|nr:hypothetical protein [Candidatus Hydrogenedentota bacterium]